MSAKWAGIYVRPSILGGTEGHADPERDSATQEEQLRKILTQHGWDTPHVYSDDPRSIRTERPGLASLLADASDGKLDLVLLWSLDRLDLGMEQLVTTLAELHSLGVHFVSHLDGLDTTGSMGPGIVKMVTTLVDTEQRVNLERAAAGLENARRYGTRSGKPVGRPRVNVPLEEVEKLKAQGWGWRRIARKLSVSASSVKRAYLKPARTVAGRDKTLRKNPGTARSVNQGRAAHTGTNRRSGKGAA